MQKSKNLSTALILGVTFIATTILVLLIIFGFNALTPNGKLFGGNTALTTPTVTVTQKINVTVKDAQGQEKSYSVDYQANKTAFELLKKLQETNQGFTFEYSQSSYGVFVTGVNGNKPDISKAFWEFRVNNQSSTVGVDSYTVKSDDQIQFIYTTVNL